MVDYVAGKQAKRKQDAQTAWETLKDKAAFDALTAAQQKELLRLAVVFLIKCQLKNDAPD